MDIADGFISLPFACRRNSPLTVLGVRGGHNPELADGLAE